MADKPFNLPIPAHVQGLRNQVAEFEGGPARLVVGSKIGPSDVGEENCVLLTIEGRDGKTGRIVDVEIAVAVSQVRELVARIVERADISVTARDLSERPTINERMSGIAASDAAFMSVYRQLSDEGACEAPGGAQQRRMRDEWYAAGKPDIEPFIRERSK